MPKRISELISLGETEKLYIIDRFLRLLSWSLWRLDVLLKTSVG